NSIAIGKKRYTFAKSAIKKIQTYFSLNPKAKQEIDKNGGIDGVIGETFVKILHMLLSQKDTNMARYTIMRSVMTNAALKQTEATIKSI
ncbi:MAG: hypothetical protein PHE56_08270, partial [Bacteroidales bacterium]|nr:hypothetical protein [Bacteroidales bacterium]